MFKARVSWDNLENSPDPLKQEILPFLADQHNLEIDSDPCKYPYLLVYICMFLKVFLRF